MVAMKVHALALAFAISVGWLSSGCSPGGLGGAGGNSGATGAGGGGGAASCPDVTACGGSVVGTWTVTSSCLTVSGTLDLIAGGSGVSVRAGHRIAPGERNVHRQRRRDLLGRHDDDRRGAVHAGAVVPGDLVDARHAAQARRASSRTWATTRSPARPRRAAAATARRPPADRGPRRGVRRAVENEQLHDLRQRGHDLGRRRRRDVLVLRVGEHVDDDARRARARR